MGKNIGTRVNLTLTDDVLAVLDRMSAVSGAGRATIIREWLETALPMMSNLAEAMEMAAAKNIDAFSVMVKSLEQAAGEADQLALDLKKKRRAAMRRKAAP